LKEDPSTIAELRHCIAHFGKNTEQHRDVGIFAGYWVHELGVPVIVVKRICQELFPEADRAIKLEEFPGEDEARWALLFHLNARPPSRVLWIEYLNGLETRERIDEKTYQQLIDEFDAFTAPEQMPPARRKRALAAHHANTTWGEEETA
jgi:hypothetical protein